MKIFDHLDAFLWHSPTANNCNAYLISDDKKILVDPGHYNLLAHVRDNLSRLSLSPEDIDVVIITHGHPDHIEGVKLFSGASVLIAVHIAEMDFVKKMAPHHGDAIGISGFEPHILLQEGDIQIGNLTFSVFHTPGHSPGSICLYWPEKKALFTGDLIFNQGVGRVDLPGGNGEELKQSIKRISTLDVEYLFPGHGDIVSGHERVEGNFKNIQRYWFPYL